MNVYSYMNPKILIGLIIAVIVIVVAAITLPVVMNNGENIKLIKEKTSVDAFYDTDGIPRYTYIIEGILQNIPNNDGFTVETIPYGPDGKEIKGVNTDAMSSSILKMSADNGEPVIINCFSTSEFVNISEVDIVVTNPDGEVVFNQTIPFDMENADLSDLKKSPSTNSSDTFNSSDNYSMYEEGDSLSY